MDFLNQNLNNSKKLKMAETRVYAKGAGTGQMKPEDPYYSVSIEKAPPLVRVEEGLAPPGTFLPRLEILVNMRFKTPPTASILRVYADLEPGKGFWKYWKYHEDTADYTWQPEWIRFTEDEITVGDVSSE